MLTLRIIEDSGYEEIVCATHIRVADNADNDGNKIAGKHIVIDMPGETHLYFRAGHYYVMNDNGKTVASYYLSDSPDSENVVYKYAENIAA